jgi:hypothetical protein
MDGPLPFAGTLQRKEGKTPWASPTLTYLGNLRDIVHGFGKSGSNVDSDPQMTTKSGMG